MSDNTNIKLKLKTAQIDLEYEGSERFLNANLLNLVLEINREVQVVKTPSQGDDQPSPNINQGTSAKFNLSANSIGAKIGVKSGSDLTIAACVYLGLSASKESFSRREILEAMKSATQYYKDDHSRNLSKYLAQLIKTAKILQQSTKLYALSNKTRTEMEMKLAN